ncbi:MAG: hypothetical protein JNK31_02725, partial [Candidatus Competibacter sp.]|nr:hypothetical protein [Candidatus Competibacter sp.]
MRDRLEAREMGVAAARGGRAEGFSGDRLAQAAWRGAVEGRAARGAAGGGASGRTIREGANPSTTAEGRVRPSKRWMVRRRGASSSH